MHPADDFWQGLDLPWRRCLELAWEAFTAGSVPVGSVLTDQVGTIQAEGRNRSAERTAPDRQIAGTVIAHAEINVLAALPPADYRRHVLWTSLEPCFLCSSALVQSGVGSVRFAAADPVVRGVERIPELNAWAAGRWPVRHGPLPGVTARFAALLIIAWDLYRDGREPVVDYHRATDPGLVALAETGRARTMLDGLRNAPAAAVVAALWDDLAPPGGIRLGRS